MGENSGLSRRSFIGGASVLALGSLGALAGCTNTENSAIANNDSIAGNGLPESWDKEVDIVVAGSGSGLLAAIDAADAGASVILLEKRGIIGGATGINEAWTTASGSRLQAENGITDDPEQHWKEWQQVNGWCLDRADLEVNKLYVTKAGEAIDRLEELGMTFHLQHDPLTWSAPRTHLAQPNATAWKDVLVPAAEERGVEILLETPAISLITNAAGEVCGIVAEDKSGATLNIKTKKGVILATGDCSNDEMIKRKYVSEEACSVPASVPSNTGDGLRMAKAIGADTSEACNVQGIGVQYDHGNAHWPTPTQKGTILINKEGKRFIDETGNNGDVGMAAFRQTDSLTYTCFGKELADVAHRPDSSTAESWQQDILDGKSMYLTLIGGVGNAFLEDFLERDTILEANSLSELAEKMEVDPIAFEETVASWNASVEAGHDEEFGRPMYENVIGVFGPTVPMKTPPFYALKSSNVFNTLSDGPNLLVNTNMEVKDVYGEAIPRLYACGAGLMTGNVVFCGQCGERMAAVVVSARVAAKEAAALDSWV